MRTIILILALVTITNLNLFGIDIYKSQSGIDGDTITNIKTLRDYRFMFIRDKPYKDDVDCKTTGNTYIIFNIIDNKKKSIQQKIKQDKQQHTKFKSTYLDFTIIQEENIS